MTLGPNATTDAKLDALDQKVARIMRSSHRRNTFTLVVGVASILLIGYWLYYAHNRFSNEVTPQLVAAIGQHYIEDYLPSASAQLQDSMEANAPHVIDEGEKQLHEMPARAEDAFRTQVNTALDQEMPTVQDRLYESMKSGLSDARKTADASNAGKSDEDRFRGMLRALAVVYGTETSGFVDQTHSDYIKNSGDIVNGLNLLAEGKNLSPQQQTQRNLVRDLLILAKESTDQNAGATTKPAQLISNP